MIEKIRSLCNKYKDQDIDIWIEFTNMSIILRAYYHSEIGKLLTYSRAYCYYNDVNLEDLLDRFVDEVLEYKRGGLI